MRAQALDIGGASDIKLSEHVRADGVRTITIRWPSSAGKPGSNKKGGQKASAAQKAGPADGGQEESDKGDVYTVRAPGLHRGASPLSGSRLPALPASALGPLRNRHSAHPVPLPRCAGTFTLQRPRRPSGLRSCSPPCIARTPPSARYGSVPWHLRCFCWCTNDVHHCGLCAPTMYCIVMVQIGASRWVVRTRLVCPRRFHVPAAHHALPSCRMAPQAAAAFSRGRATSGAASGVGSPAAAAALQTSEKHGRRSAVGAAERRSPPDKGGPQAGDDVTGWVEGGSGELLCAESARSVVHRRPCAIRAGWRVGGQMTEGEPRDPHVCASHLRCLL